MRRIVVGNRSKSDKLPPFKPRLVQNNDEFSRVQVTGEDLVFPLLHNYSMTDVVCPEVSARLSFFIQG